MQVAILSILSLSMTSTAGAQTKITIDRNVGSAATGYFKFKNVPSSVKDDVAAGAKLDLVLGERDSNGGTLGALTDGLLPTDEDEPRSNFFFNAGQSGGRFRFDLGRIVELSQVNSYSWHSDSRAPQVYNLYASDGMDKRFNAAPDAKTHPASCGWKLIASVDTRQQWGEDGGQYGVSITHSSGSLGKYRYLLFDAVEAETDDPYGNTFFSEIDVIAKK